MIRQLSRSKIEKIFAIAIVFIFIGSNPEIAFAKDEDVSQLVKQLNDLDFTERRKAVDELTDMVIGQGRKVNEKYIRNEEIRSNLIALFIKESSKEIRGEGYGEYHSLLTTLVASLEDRRAIPYLLNSFNRESEQYLARTKDKRILERMLKDVEEGNYQSRRAAAIRIMSRMCKLGNVDKDERKKIKKILIESCRGKSHSVRIWALRGLVELGDTDVSPLLKSLAKDDPYSRRIDASVRGGKKGEKIKIYPVRKEAEKALKQLGQRNQVE